LALVDSWDESKAFLTKDSVVLYKVDGAYLPLKIISKGTVFLHACFRVIELKFCLVASALMLKLVHYLRLRMFLY